MGASEQVLPVGTWVAPPGGSTIGFRVEHHGVRSLRGRFADYAVRLAVPAGDPGAARLEGTARAASADIGEGCLGDRLRSAAVLDAVRHPELRFRSTGIRRDGDLIELDGILAIRDRPLLVVATGTVAVAGPSLALALETYVDRRQFGLDWNLVRPGGGLAFGTEVKLEVDLVLQRLPVAAQPLRRTGVAS